MNFQARQLLFVGIVVAVSTPLLGCQRQPTADIQPAQTSGESFQISGDYELHYNAVRSDSLQPDIARAYGIERSKNKVLLNISVLNKAGGNSVAGDADVHVVTRNLNGQVKDITLRRVAEEQAIYYLGEVSFSGAETLVFDITATPTGSTLPITASLTREFFAD